MILTPAYGRDYKSQQAVLDDFNADKDFILNDLYSPRFGSVGTYINRTQVLQEQTHLVTFRYDKLRKSFIHKLG